MYIADLHIHSRFSRATSKDGDLPHLDFWARRKGIGMVGTGDFTHPAWRAELHEQLVPAGDGVYTLREELRLPGAPETEPPRFVVTGEISSIYKRDGRTRKVHNLIVLPSLEAADELSAKLEAIGNIHSDGRPILGLDSRDLLELTLDTCPEAEFIPAHIWTPHFSVFGAFSGFRTLEECFDDLTPHIHAVETGLSSDPPMNWRVSALDGLTLVSHSDAHSPSKLGREADLIDAPCDYPGLIGAVRTGNGFLGTVEFFPEEGKYHLDGHRNCGVCLTPAETIACGGICPVCGKKLTIGVEHRVEELADRPEGFRPASAKPFESLVPLPEVIAACTGGAAAGKKAMQLYARMLRELGPEFGILREADPREIERVAGACVAEGICRLRAGKVERHAGYDGAYGTITLLSPDEIEQYSGQISMFGIEPIVQTPKAKKPTPHPMPREDRAVQEELGQPQPAYNPAQQQAIETQAQVTAVIAGPGTGKTRTLVARIAYLIETCGVRPEEITAVTFTNQAAAEMRQRLEARLGGKRAVSRMTIGTFHAICRKLLAPVRLLGPGEAITLAAGVLREQGSKQSPKKFLQAVSRVKNGAEFETAGVDAASYEAYCSKLHECGALDFDDLLIEALQKDTAGHKNFEHVLVDEFQDINDTQFALVRAWSQGRKSLFVIGDPDQSIYGFRGASGRCFERLQQQFPAVQTIRLVENYRSAPEILRASGAVIQKNPGGVRQLDANRPTAGPVRLVCANDPFSEAVFVAKEIGRLTGGVDMLEAQRLGSAQQAHAFSEIAVLCRTHRGLDLIEKCLQHDDIPCIVSGREAFLEADDVRAVLAFFRVLDVPGDAAALETALHLIWDCPGDLIAKAQAACAGMEQFDPEALTPQVQGFGHLEAWLARCTEWLPHRKDKPWKCIARWEGCYGSSETLERLRCTAVFHPNFTALWDALALGQEADLCRASGKGWKSGAVRLMTLHGAKGLEFPVVFVAGVTAGELPLESPSRPADVQEERRLFYVGMTRAQEQLILTCGGTPSAFLADLPAEVQRELRAPRPVPEAEQLSLF